MLDASLLQFRAVRQMMSASPVLARQVKLLGELSDRRYQSELANSSYLWHAGRIDNGTFSVVEAASLGLQSLSSDYPAMREIDAQFGLNLMWMDPHDPADMAKQLKMMETSAQKFKSPASLASQSLDNLAPAYWAAIRECL